MSWEPPARPEWVQAVNAGGILPITEVAELPFARDALLAEARRQLAAGQPPDAVLEQLAAALTNRLLHAPSAALREAAAKGDASLADAAVRLFRPGREPR